MRTRRYAEGAVDGLPQAWADCDLIVSHLALGATTRIIAPLLASKKTDPGVVVVDEAGRFAVPLVGGHGGGANDLARRIADGLGATTYHHRHRRDGPARPGHPWLAVVG